MSNHESLVLEHLRALRAGQDETMQRLDRVEIRLSAIEQTLGSMYALSASDRDTLQSVIKRVERIERRLELTENQG
jgi:archaellum component FlaC